MSFRNLILCLTLLVAPALASAGTLFAPSSAPVTVTGVDGGAVSDSWVGYTTFNPDFTVLDDATITVNVNGNLVDFDQVSSLTGQKFGYDVWYGTVSGTSRFSAEFGSAYFVSIDNKLYGSVTYAGEGYEIYPVGPFTSGSDDVVMAQVLAVESDGSGGTCDDSDAGNMCNVTTEDENDPATEPNNTIRVGVIIGDDAVLQVKMTLQNGNDVEVSVIPYVMGSITRSTDIARASGSIGATPLFDLVGFDIAWGYYDSAKSVQGNYLDVVSLSTTTGLMGVQHTKRAAWDADLIVLWIDQKSDGKCDYAQTYSGITPQWGDRAFAVSASNRGCEVLDMAPARSLTRLTAARQGVELPHAYEVEANRWLGSYVDGTLTRAGDISAPTNSIYYPGGDRRVELLSNCAETEFDCANTRTTDPVTGALTYSTENANVVGYTWNDVANYYELCHVADPTRCP